MTKKKQRTKARLKETESMGIWLGGGLVGERNHGSNKKNLFGMLYPLELTTEGLEQ